MPCYAVCMKKLLLFALPAIVVIAVVAMMLVRRSHRDQALRTVDRAVTTISDTVAPAVQPVQLCFYKKTPAGRGLSDVSWLRLNIAGNAVSGEYQSVPV